MTAVDRNDKLEFILSRHSASALGMPGPTREQLEQILNAAGTVPDHGRLRPFRFAIVEGNGRTSFGDALARAAAERKPELSAGALDGIRAKAFRSPTIIVLIASPKPGKIERWEQHAAAACAGYAIVLAAHALGVGAVWKSVPFTRGQALTELLGLGEPEEMLGWLHLGTPTAGEAPAARTALDLSSLVTVIDDHGTSRFGSQT